MLLEPHVAAQDACLPNEDPFASASLWDGLELPPLDEGDDAASAEEPEQGEPHNAHVVAYRAHREREAHVARLHAGVDDIWSHLDGSFRCMTLGRDVESLHVRHLWADEAELETWAESTPYGPAGHHPVYPAKGYPQCFLPWAGWPPVVGSGHSALLHIFRIWRAEAVVLAQIAATGGLDDWAGWIIRPQVPDFESLAAWRRRLFLPPSEQEAARKAEKRGRKTRGQREQRARDAGKDASQGRIVRPVVVDGDFAFVPLSMGYTARLPAADAPLVEGHNWHVIAATGKAPFATRLEKREDGSKVRLRMHRLEGLSGPVEIIPPAAAPPAPGAG
ncbi:hypothetical protein V5F38_10380 [Xanthobacter sp. V0B-10]|uniref:hypothetical protein n=1 Tax=Xanthobacter albus TaxID=3119929 RepID=UPI003726C863